MAHQPVLGEDLEVPVALEDPTAVVSERYQVVLEVHALQDLEVDLDLMEQVLEWRSVALEDQSAIQHAEGRESRRGEDRGARRGEARVPRHGEDRARRRGADRATRRGEDHAARRGEDRGVHRGEDRAARRVEDHVDRHEARRAEDRVRRCVDHHGEDRVDQRGEGREDFHEVVREVVRAVVRAVHCEVHRVDHHEGRRAELHEEHHVEHHVGHHVVDHADHHEERREDPSEVVREEGREAGHGVDRVDLHEGARACLLDAWRGRPGKGHFAVQAAVLVVLMEGRSEVLKVDPVVGRWEGHLAGRLVGRWEGHWVVRGGRAGVCWLAPVLAVLRRAFPVVAGTAHRGVAQLDQASEALKEALKELQVCSVQVEERRRPGSENLVLLECLELMGADS